MRRKLSAVLLLSGLAHAGCARGGEAAPGVLHLDPRLADGRSCAAVLEGALACVEHRPEDSEPGHLGPFRVEGGRLGRSDQGAFLSAAEGAGGPARLVLAEPLDGARFPRIEVELAARRPTEALLEWRGAAGPGRLVVEVPASPEPRVVVFDASLSDRWRGALEDLVLTPSADADQAVRIALLRLVPTGFRLGDEPLDPPGLEDAGEAGLRRAGFDARRAWPADLEVPLFARVERVPREGVLSVALARGNCALGAPGSAAPKLGAAIDVRSGAGRWRRIAETELADSRPERWTPLRADLSAFAGQTLELRFLAFSGSAPAADAFPTPRSDAREEHLLWGAPEVLGEPPAERRPNLFLITLDTTRADLVGGPYSPFLNDLSDEALVFSDAWTACNSTTPSHTSILTGLHVEEHGVLTNRHALDPGLTTLAEELRAAGYHTEAVVSVPHIQAGVGFGQGFDRFALAQPGAELNGAIALRWVERFHEEHAGLPDRPLFLWVHLFDPHTPYLPPPEFVEAFTKEHGIVAPPKTAVPATMPVYPEPRDPESVPIEKRWRRGISSLEYARFLYALGVAYADSLCQRMFAGWQRAGLLEQAAGVIVADHGEALGEHNVWFDHAGLSRETLQVPLFLFGSRLPSELRGTRCAALVSSIDIAPTLLEFAAVRPRSPLAGISLLGSARGGVPGDRTVYFAFNDLVQTGYRNADEHFVTTNVEGLYHGTGLFLENGENVPRRLAAIPRGASFLYDPRADPALLRDLAPERPGEAALGLERLERWRAGLRRVEAERRALTEAEESQLQNLGYTGD